MEETISTTINAEEGIERLEKYVQTSNFWLSLIILAVGIVIWQVLKHVRNKLKEKTGELTTVSNVVYDIIRVVFIFVLIIVLLQINGVNVSALITGLGVVSAIVGLALQDFFKDIIMGVHILTDKFYKVGDVVRYNGIEGKVISFNIRTTKLELIDYKEVVTICNRNISEITVVKDMFDLDVNLSYSEDPKRVHETMKVLSERIAKIKGITKAEYKGTQNFDDSYITYRLRYWTSPDGRRQDIRREANMLVQDGLKEFGIPFAYPHVDVKLIENS